jgi:hypothetical protein
VFLRKETTVKQTRENLEGHLARQLAFLQRSADAYDKGFTDEATRLAVPIRVLVHDARASASLLHQLNEKSRDFYDTAVPAVSGNLVMYGALIQMAIGPGGATYIPYLDGPLPAGKPTWVSFDKWWRRIIFANPEGLAMSRKDLVLAVANQDGGAHVDPSLDEAYAKLSRGNAMGWVFEKEGAHYAVRPAEFAAVRQIAHEILKTFDPAMVKETRVPEGAQLIMANSVITVDS